MSFPTKIEGLISKLEIEYDGNNNPIYVGVSVPGMPTSNPGWRIAFLTYDGNNNCLSVTFAEGNLNLDKIWDDRASYSYS